MQLTPRFGPDPVLRIEGLVDDPATPLIRQRQRLAATMARLDRDQWTTPSRCAGWSIQDVAAHLTTTNQFWDLSITSALGGEPTRFLTAFDPVVTPAQLVDAVRSQTPDETLEGLIASNDALNRTIVALDDDSWSQLAEAPPGHLAIRLLALHALWDAWIHERDVSLPLGLEPPLERDEIEGALIYVVGLGPALSALGGATRCGTLEVRAADPQMRMVAEVGPTVVLRPAPPDRSDPPDPATATLNGDAVGLIEALSFRVPLRAELAPGDRWLLGDLGRAFDQPA